MTTLKTFFKKFSNDWTMNLASMLAYSLITTIFPLLLGILSLAGIVLGRISPGQMTTVATNIGKALPGNIAGPGKAIDTAALLHGLISLSGPLAIVALVGLLWTGSNLFTNMENAFSIIFRVADRGFVPQRLMGMGMVLVLAILLPLSLGASSLVTAGSAALHGLFPPPLGALLSYLGPLASLVLLWVLFLIMYKVVPNTDVPWRDVWKGALAAAILFALLQLLFPLYFKTFLSGNAKYGATAATILVLVIWLWFFGLITLIGAQINAVAMGIKPTRYDVARTFCNEYREEIEQQEPSQPERAGRALAVIRFASRGLRPETRFNAGAILTAPLRMLALLAWIAIRPFVGKGSERTRATSGIGSSDRPHSTGTAVG